jgi:hypothetical protein
MNSHPLFDLPVYRLPEDAYYRERDAYIEDYIQAAGGHDRDPDVITRIRSHGAELFGGPWQYNEIMSFVRLHFDGSQILGHYYAPNAKRVVKSRRKVFWYQTHKLAPEIDIGFDPTSDKIFALIKQYVDACRRELPRRWIDDEQLMHVGPYVDWKSLYEKSLHDAAQQTHSASRDR